MKLHININLNKININKLDNINYLLKNKIIFKQIYSEEGIYNLKNNNIQKLIIENSEIQKINLYNIDLILDKENISYKDNISQIPYNHKIFNVEIFQYYINKNDKLTLNLKYLNNKLYDVYFDLKENNIANHYNNIKELLKLIV